MKKLPLREAKTKLLLLSLMHLLTDALCAYLIISRLYPENPRAAVFVFLGYNFCAFVLQAPVGALIDRGGNPPILLLACTALLALGYLLGRWWLPSVLLLGLGNALFHVAGGKYVTEKSGNDPTHLGVFVATGAIGLTVGRAFASFAALPYLLLAVLTGCALLLLFSEETKSKAYASVYEGKGMGASYALLLVLFAVFIRAFLGKAVTVEFEVTHVLLWVMTAATALGKVMGGVCARRFGAVRTVIVSMALAAVCLTLGCHIPVFYAIGLFAFNFSMPITLYFANAILKGETGFAFGVLAATLFPGYLAAMLLPYPTAAKILAAILCPVTVLITVILARRIKNADESAFSDHSP